MPQDGGYDAMSQGGVREPQRVIMDMDNKSVGSIRDAAGEQAKFKMALVDNEDAVSQEPKGKKKKKNMNANQRSQQLGNKTVGAQDLEDIDDQEVI